jgi:type IV pilus assembly protein PilB
MADESGEGARRLAEQHGLRFVDLSASPLTPGAAQLLPENVARRHRVVPIGRRLGTPVIAVADPGDLYAMDALRASVGREFVAVVAPADQVDQALDDLYPPSNGHVPVAAPGVTPPPVVPAPVPTPPAQVAPPAQGNGSHPVPPAPTADQILGSAAAGDGGPPAAPAAPAPQFRGRATPTSPAMPPPVPPGTEAPVGPGAEALPEAPLPPVGGPPPAAAAPVDLPSSPSDVSEELHRFAPPEPPDEGDAGEGGAGLPPVPAGYGLVEGAEAPASPFYGPPLARVLVDAGRVSPEDMGKALQAHQDTGESLARYLFNQQLATEEDLVWAMAQEVGLEFVDLTRTPVDRAVATLIPEATARHHMVLPIGFSDGVPVVAMANPTDVFAMDDLRTIMGRNFTPVVATRSQIAYHLRYSQDSGIDVSEVAADASAAAGQSADFELESLQAVVEDAPIVRYVNLLILQALNERASDIHIEPTPKRLRIRFRIDGVMHDATSASISIASAVVSRMKVLGEMDITEHRIPQEGRVSLSVSDRQIDLRLAVLPSLYGETVVMRLLDKSASLRSLPDLGFLPETLDRYSGGYHHPYGVILVTGPTGAGKTTTLYATLQEVMSPEKSVVTVEDPVEYQIEGIIQVQINQKAGLAFSTALRSILRADPDIVLIGEIRDTDTATIAMEAALSGHLVLSTLHTNTAAATPLRLTEMGIEPFLVTSAVSTVLTQRLCRVLCEACKEEYEATEEDFVAAGYSMEQIEALGEEHGSLYRATGCRSCGHKGYLGRMVLAEVMNMSEEIDRMIISQAPTLDIERLAKEQGMRTLREDGLLKALRGRTTLEEVLRVVV